MRKLGFAIIGAGFAGQWHAKALTGIEQAELRAVYNRSAERGKALANEYNIDWYDNFEKLLSRDDIAVVNICTSSSLHSDFAILAAKAGKHLIIEKPLDVTVDKCDQIIKAVKENNLKLSVIYQNRFKDAVQALHSALDEGRFGKLVLGDAHIKWYRPEEYFKGSWKGTKKYDGGGALMNQGSHTIDLLQWMMGEVESVNGDVKTLLHDIEVEDVGVATLRFKNGALGVIEGSTAIYPGLDERLGIYGEKGSVEIEGNRIVTWKFREERKDDKEKRLIGGRDHQGGGAVATGIGIENHRRQLQEIITAVIEDRKPLVDGEEGKKSVKIIEAIYRSMEKQSPVKLD
jgi:predicted dehydrogenase